MARIRTLKPELARHRGLFDLEKELDLPVRFAWAMLPTVCDREGRFRWRPWELKLDILPYEPDDAFSRVLDAWLTRGYLVRYRVNNEWFGWLPTFRKHQQVNPREKESEIPEIGEADEVDDYRNQQHSDASVTRDSRDNDASSTRQDLARGEGKGREGKGTSEIGDSNPPPQGTQDPPPPPKFTDDDLALAKAIYADLLKINPKHKTPNWPKWADCIRLMRERDKRTHDEIRALWVWAHHDSFWRKNVLSPDTLRDKWDRLVIQRNTPGRSEDPPVRKVKWQ